MIIGCAAENQTIAFAKEELTKYLFLLDKIIPDSFVIELGYTDITDDEIDSVEVNVGKNGGTLKGSNPRSVLYAVYQYLEALGVRWVRHGQDGEYIPEGVKVPEKEVSFTRTAKNKFRGMMIEGGINIELMLSDIDWCAKMGINDYYLQFFDQGAFFERWMSHKKNPLWIDARKVSHQEAMEYRNKMAFELKKRGMRITTGGHGLTCTPYGVSIRATKEEVTDEMRAVLAEINGKRQILRSVGNTQLCYSNPEVTEKLAGFIADYARKNPEVDVYAVTFADSLNNYCECSECKKILPSDAAVRIANRADEIMTAEGLKMRFKLSVYLDTLWAPREKLKNPKRAIMTFAPIGRNYKVSYDEMQNLPEPPAFVYNKNENPTDVNVNLALFKKWRQTLPESDSYSIEYFNWNAQRYADMGTLNAAEIVYRDIKALEQVGLDGTFNCQSQRSFLPTGLVAYIHAKAFWEPEKPYMDFVKEYFESAFGEYADLFYSHFRSLSDLSKEENSFERAEKLLQITSDILLKIKEIEGKPTNVCHVKSVFYAKYHAMVFKMVAEADMVYYRDGQEASLSVWQKIIDFVRKTEASVYGVLDLVHFLNFLTGKLHPGFKELKALTEEKEKGYVFF